MKKASSYRFLDKRTGVGLVISNMIGSGVFLSTGFMMQKLSPELILWSWVAGAVIALCGAIAYAEIARINGRSGGEYRYLYDYFHPYIGYLAGWASLLIGFSAPIAIDAYVAGAFLNRIGVDLSPQMTGIIVILVITLAHGLRYTWSRSIQNILVSSKFLFILIFIAVGIAGGQNVWPNWSPPPTNSEAFYLNGFLENQYWIAFAFSGWNAAIYTAGEYKNPKRDVYFSLITGCLTVACVYLAINWIFIVNLTPQESLAVFDYDKTQVTLAHVIMEKIIGSGGAQGVSLVAFLVFVSAISSMTLVGPRIYAQMADDRLIPGLFANRYGKPPIHSIILQSSIALFLLYTQSVRDILMACSSVLMLFSMLTSLILFKIHRDATLPDTPAYSLVAALIYAISVISILYFGINTAHSIAYIFAVILIAGSIGYWTAKKIAGNRKWDSH